jgi:hypothetical protein
MRPSGTNPSTSRPIFPGIIIVIAILAISPVVAFDGQTVWMTTERAPIIEDSSRHAEHPRAVSDGNGGVVVVWQHDFTGGVRIQRLDHTGAQQWISTGVVLSSTGYQPQVAIHPNGGVVVAWHETEVTKTGIYVQRVTAGGSPAWTPGGVQIATTARMPAVCATSTVGTFVSWIDLANDARIGNINDAGQPTAPGVNGISLGANGVSAFRMGLVQAGLGSVIAVWQDNSSPSRILAQKVGPGLPWGGTPRVVGAPANRHNQIPVADRDGVGGAVVAWQSLPWSGATGGIQFRTQRIDGDGTTQWGPGGIVLVDSDVVGGEYSQWTLNHTLGRFPPYGFCPDQPRRLHPANRSVGLGGLGRQWHPYGPDRGRSRAFGTSGHRSCRWRARRFPGGIQLRP